MRRETNQSVRRHRENEKRIGLLLAAMTLLGSARLLGKGGASTSRTSRVQDQTTPLHVLVVSIPDRKLAVMADGHVLKVYDVAVGRPSTPSPTGEMKITNKVVDPTYYHQGTVVKPGKSNPLGNRWMGLSYKGYGIHGTNVQSSVGKAASHGCFRMRKHDVEELFNTVRVGDVVEIRGEHDPQLSEIFVDSAKVAQAAPRAEALLNVQRAPQSRAIAMAVMSGEIGN